MITIRPSSGLCNRLRAIASGIRLARECHEQLRIDWYYCPIKRWAPALGMAIPYSRIFEESDEFKVFNHLRVKYEMPWDKRIYDPSKADIFSEKHGDAFVELCLKRKSDGEKRFWTCFNFYPCNDYSWLRPREKILKMVDEGAHDFGTNTIGMHIRRTDNGWSIEHSPLSLFTKKIEEEIDRDHTTKIFLATDSLETKQMLVKKYAGRVVTRFNNSPRYTLKGEVDGLIDLLLLSRTKKVYGSFMSSFSDLAAQIGKCPIEILKV